MARLKPSDFASVREAVEKFEKVTRGELVPLVVADAGEYGWVKYKTGLFGFVFALVGGEAWSHFRTWPLDAHEVTVLVTLGVLVGTVVGMVPAVARIFLGQAHTAAVVHRRALSEFTHQGCGNTHEKIGILVMVALLERRIEIIADSGIQSVVAEKEGPDVWHSVTARFSEAAARGEAVQGLIATIESIGTLLGRHFPANGTHENELSDELRTED